MYSVTWKVKFVSVFSIGTTSTVDSYEDNEKPLSNDNAKKKSMWNLALIIMH